MRLRFADGSVLDPGGRTVVMGILNVTPDSFSDGAATPTRRGRSRPGCAWPKRAPS